MSAEADCCTSVLNAIFSALLSFEPFNLLDHPCMYAADVVVDTFLVLLKLCHKM